MHNDINNLKEDILNENKSNQEYSEKELLLVNENNELKREIDSLKNIIDEKNKLQSYLKADIENIKRNNKKEVDFTVNRELQKIVVNFLSVIDDYERSLIYVKTLQNPQLKDVIDGLTITYKSFLKALQDLGVQEISTEGMFNPEYHEAISSISEATKQSDEIINTIQKGFLYKQQLIRPAKVIIAK